MLYSSFSIINLIFIVFDTVTMSKMNIYVLFTSLIYVYKINKFRVERNRQKKNASYPYIYTERLFADSTSGFVAYNQLK